MPVSRRRASLALAGALLTLGSTAAFAAEDEFVPQLVTGEQFLQCGSPSKEYVVGSFVNDDAGTPSWGEAAPASVTTGAGCGKLDEPTFSGTIQETPYTFAFKGTFRGNLDELTFTIHTADLGVSRAPGTPITLAVRATVGGKSLFGFTERTSVSGAVVASPEERLVTLTPVATGATGQVRSLTFTVTGIDFLTEADLTRKAAHPVVVDVRDATPNPATTASNVHGWVWGAAEAPSGVVFTPEEPAAVVMQADPREGRK